MTNFFDTRQGAILSAQQKALTYQFDAETRRIERQRAADYAATGARHLMANWQDAEFTVATVVVYRGGEFNTYTVRRRSPSAYRLAALFGGTCKPLFDGSATICKAVPA